MFKKILSLIVIVCFVMIAAGPYAHADSALDLPQPGTMINLSPAYEPVIIKGLTVHKDNPFLFDFIIDSGQERMSGQPLKKEGEKLIKYFLASLTIPDKDLWVNLSPYEKNRMIPEALGQTDMGRDLLEQDYILKQITASLIYPEKKLGKAFWDKVYTQAQERYGTMQVPINTFNKVWIMADRAEVFEHNQTAFVVGSHLKVMLEEDYLALQKHRTYLSTTHSVASQIIKKIILPELEKEVNEGRNFANLRQIFNSIILSSWYKRNLKQTLLNQVYADKSRIKGIDLNDPTVKQQIYEQYLKAYKKGVFNYIKEDVNGAGVLIPHRYFSGGIVDMEIDPAMTSNPAMLINALPQEGERLIDFKTFVSSRDDKQEQRSNAAMAATAWADEEISVTVTRMRKNIRVEFNHIDGERVEKEGDWSPEDNVNKIAEIIAGRVERAIYESRQKDIRYGELERLIEDHVSVDEAMLSRRRVLRGAGALAGLAALKYAAGEFFLPYEGKVGKMMVLSNGGRFDGAKKTKILIHGANENDIPNSFSGMAREATSRDENFVVYAYDQNSSMDEWVRDLIRGIKSLGFDPKSIEYIPYSMGAVIFWNAVLRDQNLFRNVRVTQLAPAIGGAQEALQFRYITLQEELAKFVFPLFASNDDIRLTIALHPEGEVKKFKDPHVYRLLLDTVGRGNIRTFQPGIDNVVIPTNSPLLGDVRAFSGVVHEHIAEDPGVIKASFDRAMVDYGGIDLNTANGTQWKDSKDGRGVEMNLDPAMIARVRRDGINRLSPVILKMTPVTSVWPLVGLKVPPQVAHLAGI